MSRPRLQTGAKTVPLVTHIPVPLKKKITEAAKIRKMGISEFVRDRLANSVRSH